MKTWELLDAAMKELEKKDLIVNNYEATLQGAHEKILSLETEIIEL